MYKNHIWENLFIYIVFIYLRNIFFYLEFHISKLYVPHKVIIGEEGKNIKLQMIELMYFII